eukprot:CAMPEP_0177650268 /NCGR_PEP_ID=MMETSP0447-20121125/11848_1 /TAXON_ID=0 /ORGANISM="Stygamoeba regulata, Strain BSH-02190019" /LENGTH=476 /DNA_ID=CAMNT_0019153119 /DNA_START=125 /DNA_END=1555 /DNA_ORIENTATION=+
MAGLEEMATALRTALGNREANTVEELVLDGPKAGHAEGLAALGDCSSLRVLSLNGVGLRSLDGFPVLPQLTRLELSDNRLQDGLVALGSARLHALQVLDLSGNQLRRVADLTPLMKLPRLNTLDLGNCPVTQEPNYRRRLFDMLPRLRVLDGYDRDGQSEESEEDDEEDDEGGANNGSGGGGGDDDDENGTDEGEEDADADAQGGEDASETERQHGVKPMGKHPSQSSDVDSNEDDDDESAASNADDGTAEDSSSLRALSGAAARHKASATTSLEEEDSRMAPSFSVTGTESDALGSESSSEEDDEEEEEEEDGEEEEDDDEDEENAEEEDEEAGETPSQAENSDSEISQSEVSQSDASQSDDDPDDEVGSQEEEADEENSSSDSDSASDSQEDGGSSSVDDDGGSRRNGMAGSDEDEDEDDDDDDNNVEGDIGFGSEGASDDDDELLDLMTGKRKRDSQANDDSDSTPVKKAVLS